MNKMNKMNKVNKVNKVNQAPAPAAEMLGKNGWDGDDRKFDHHATIWGDNDTSKNSVDLLGICRSIIRESRDRLESSFEPDDGIMDANYCSGYSGYRGSIRVNSNDMSSGDESDMIEDYDGENVDSEQDDETSRRTETAEGVTRSPFFYT